MYVSGGFKLSCTRAYTTLHVNSFVVSVDYFSRLHWVFFYSIECQQSMTWHAHNELKLKPEIWTILETLCRNLYFKICSRCLPIMNPLFAQDTLFFKIPSGEQLEI